MAALLLAGLAALWLVGIFAAFRPAGAVETRPASRDEAVWAYDYQAYLNAAVRLLEDGSLYQAETLAGPYRPGPFGLYLYSPTLGVGLLPVARMDVTDSAVLWFVAHVVALVAACALMPVRPQIRLVAFAVAALSFAVARDMALGNVSVLLLLPMTMAWRWLDRPQGSMAQALAISVRPTLGIIVVWQLLRRRWRAVAWTLGSGLVLMALTLPFVGLGGYLDYVTVLRNMSGVTGVPFNVDLGSVALELGAGEPVPSLALMAGYAVAVTAVLLSLRRDREVGFMVTLTASLLLAPLLWDHYLAMLILPAAFLAERGRSWALLLPLASWLPGVVPAWTFMYPLIVVVAVWLPFLAAGAGTGRATAQPGPATVRTAPA